MRPETLTDNHKKDIEIFHKKGSAILMCWQTPGVGLGLPATKEGVSGYQNFHNKYPYPECYEQWPAIYARELARYIIAMDFDGYDVDWETCGDHGHEQGGNQGDEIPGFGFVFCKVASHCPEGHGGKHLVGPGEVTPDEVEAFGVGKAENQHDTCDEEHGGGDQQSFANGFLFEM